MFQDISKFYNKILFTDRNGPFNPTNHTTTTTHFTLSNTIIIINLVLQFMLLTLKVHFFYRTEVDKHTTSRYSSPSRKSHSK